jgi:hypothetical protein
VRKKPLGRIGPELHLLWRRYDSPQTRKSRVMGIHAVIHARTNFAPHSFSVERVLRDHGCEFDDGSRDRSGISSGIRICRVWPFVPIHFAIKHTGETHQHGRCACRTLFGTVTNAVAILAEICRRQGDMLHFAVSHGFTPIMVSAAQAYAARAANSLAFRVRCNVRRGSFFCEITAPAGFDRYPGCAHNHSTYP